MIVAAALSGIAIATALYVALGGCSGPVRGLIAAGSGAVCGGLLLLAPRTAPPAPPDNRPLQSLEDGYTSSTRCIACHPGNVSSWKHSYHRTMTQIASADGVAGDFEDVSLELEGESYHLYRRGDSVGVELPSGEERDIVMTTGSHHMQIYWYEAKARVNGQLPFVWLIEEARWIPRNAAFLRPPGLRHGSEEGRFNQVCIRCHTTHGRLGGMSLDDPETRAAELGIACEACHGPSEAHVASFRDPVARYMSHLSAAPVEGVVNPESLDARRSSQVCGQCHGISVFHDQAGADSWAEHGYRFRPGDDLTDERFPVVPDNLDRPIMASVLADPNYLRDRFWRDGMVRVSGREYNGLIESPCYRSGDFSCSSCHEMHPDDPSAEWATDQLRANGRDGGTCVGCHTIYDSEVELTAHTGHEASSSGSACMNCHMPYTTYGLLKAIRSHTIDSPSVSASLATGRPNACNQCHLDRSLGWTARELSRRYGVPVPDGVPHDDAASISWALSGDAGQRALMAWNFGWAPARQASGTDWMVPVLGQLIDDPYDAVRFIAARSLRRFDGFSNWEYDFMSSRVSRAQAKRAIWSGWSGSPNDVVLVRSDGSYDWERFEKLVSDRDDRRVNLQE